MPGRIRQGGGDAAMRMIHEEYYDEPKARPAPRVKTAKASVSLVTPKSFGGYGGKSAGASVGLPSVMPSKGTSAARSVRRPSVAQRGGGDEAMAIVQDASWSSAEQRRVRKR